MPHKGLKAGLLDSVGEFGELPPVDMARLGTTMNNDSILSSLSRSWPSVSSSSDRDRVVTISPQTIAIEQWLGNQLADRLIDD